MRYFWHFKVVWGVISCGVFFLICMFCFPVSHSWVLLGHTNTVPLPKQGFRGTYVTPYPGSSLHHFLLKKNHENSSRGSLLLTSIWRSSYVIWFTGKAGGSAVSITIILGFEKWCFVVISKWTCCILSQNTLNRWYVLWQLHVIKLPFAFSHF